VTDSTLDSLTEKERRRSLVEKIACTKDEQGTGPVSWRNTMLSCYCQANPSHFVVVVVYRSRTTDLPGYRTPFQGGALYITSPRPGAPDFAKPTSRLAFWRHLPQHEGRHSFSDGGLGYSVRPLRGHRKCPNAKRQSDAPLVISNRNTGKQHGEKFHQFLASRFSQKV
jgi:hypothetical protein